MTRQRNKIRHRYVIAIWGHDYRYNYQDMHLIANPY